MMQIAESHVEEAALAWLAELGYQVISGPSIAPDTPHAERESYGDVVLAGRLRAAIVRLNPHLAEDVRDDVFRAVMRQETPSLVEENRRLHEFITNGVPVEVRRADGTISGEIARLMDFAYPNENDWLAVNQFTVIEHQANRRPDVVLFVNGLPLAVIELKNPGDENATLDGAHRQLETYKGQIPSMFRSNAALVISDGLAARIGSLTADRERFMPWRTVDGGDLAPKAQPELETLLKGVFEKGRFLALLKDFVVFGETEKGLAKILAGYHQFHAVRHAIGCTLEAALPEGNRKVGVIWHTQGSGKSLLMAFYAGVAVKHPALENPTLLVLTDRNDLDEQLFATFSMCKSLLRQTPQRAESREELRQMLDRPSGGVVFSTIQKFAPEPGSTVYEVLTARRNVIVIADEAHRSQYGFGAKMNHKSGKTAYGFAKYLRDGLPNASFIGFTGTPIETSDVNTKGVFGDYIDIYDISRAVADGATVPIYYESRLARIALDEDERPLIDDEVAELTEDEAETEQERLKAKWSRVEAVVGAEHRLKLIAKNLVEHAERRFAALQGKAMVVCMSRRICVALYDEIVALRPQWHSDDDAEGVIKVVMTGAASDPASWQPHIGKRPKARREALAIRAKDPKDPLKIVIVRDMWLTGFDAPCMHTMYVDKPMQGHGLMQAIARVNRVFKDKPAGLVVDYIGIAQSLKAALGQYSKADQDQTGIDEAQAVAVLVEKYEVVRDMFRPGRPGGFDYRPALAPNATPQERLKVMAGAYNHVLEMQQVDAAKEKTEEGRKRALRRFADAVLALSKAYALAAASDEAKKLRDEVGFFQAIRAAMAKTGAEGGKSKADRELAIQQIVSRAVVSTEIVDILHAAGIATPDISILSDEFLAEVKELQARNLALEALKKLINGQIHAQSRQNVTQARAFSERLEEAIARYHANALTTVQVIEELIKLAKDMKAAQARGEDLGLSQEEIAFYDALAENQSARDVMGDPALRIIAHDLVVSIKGNLPTDWMHREAARARLRRDVRRILRKYGYPPDLQDTAVQAVLRQAEELARELV
ncbi:type I restriction enzyme R subunit [Acidocella aromatica]|uniref:Type I restriction enzyme endonuclease subunit n=1 Tax=Acidocella aromatica TaxID=1303579 RepID=A0A840VSA4_9PROT|nr:type I restriction enzyme R subunit [Acidocella aromatica]